MERARKAHYRMAAVRAVEGAAQEFGSLLKPNGEVNTDTVHRVFGLFDTDSNGHIDQSAPAPALPPQLTLFSLPVRVGSRGWGGHARGEHARRSAMAVGDGLAWHKLLLVHSLAECLE